MGKGKEWRQLIYTVKKALSGLGNGCSGSIFLAHAFSESARSRVDSLCLKEYRKGEFCVKSYYNSLYGWSRELS